MWWLPWSWHLSLNTIQFCSCCFFNIQMKWHLSPAIGLYPITTTAQSWESLCRFALNSSNAETDKFYYLQCMECIHVIWSDSNEYSCVPNDALCIRVGQHLQNLRKAVWKPLSAWSVHHSTLIKKCIIRVFEVQLLFMECFMNALLALFRLILKNVIE